MGTATALSEKFNGIHRGKSEAFKHIVSESEMVVLKIVWGRMSINADDGFGL